MNPRCTRALISISTGELLFIRSIDAFDASNQTWTALLLVNVGSQRPLRFGSIPSLAASLEREAPIIRECRRECNGVKEQNMGAPKKNSLTSLPALQCVLGFKACSGVGEKRLQQAAYLACSPKPPFMHALTLYIHGKYLFDLQQPARAHVEIHVPMEHATTRHTSESRPS